MDLVDKVMEECFQTRFLELLLKKVLWGYLTCLHALPETREPEFPFVLVDDEAFPLKNYLLRPSPILGIIYHVCRELPNFKLISILFLFQRFRPSLIID